MPHVVLEGVVDLPGVFRRFELVERREQADVRKNTDAFLNRSGQTMLLESIVVERGRVQKFMIAVGRKKDGASVRLDPLTDPEKTRGVRALLADVALEIRRLCPDTRFGKTNLDEFLPDLDGGSADPDQGDRA